MDETLQRRRMVNANNHNLPDLPVEIYDKIIRFLADPRDVTTLEDLENLRKVPTFADKVEHSLPNVVTDELLDTYRNGLSAISDLPAGRPGLDVGLPERLDFSTEADFISIRPIASRKTIVDEVLRHSRSDASLEALHRVISNAEYLSAEDRTRVAKFTGELGFRKKAEIRVFCHLIHHAPFFKEDLSELVKISCALAEISGSKEHLQFWGKHIGLVSKHDQDKLLNSVCNGVEPADALAAFAEHAAAMTETNRSRLAEQIFALPVGATGRWHALSKLAGNLPSLAVDVRNLLVSHFISAWNSTRVEKSDGHWARSERICQWDTLGHLFKHRNLVELSCRNSIVSSVSKLLDNDARWDPQKLIMIGGISSDGRRGFVQSVLSSNNAEVRKAALYHSTIVVGDMNADEKDKFVRTLIASAGADFRGWHACIHYNLHSNMEHFTTQQRTDLISAQLTGIVENQGMWKYAGRNITVLEEKSELLSSKDICCVMGASAKMTLGSKGARVDPAEDERFRFSPGQAARCLANWIGERLSKERIEENILMAGGEKAQSEKDTDWQGVNSPSQSKRQKRSAGEMLGEDGGGSEAKRQRYERRERSQSPER